LSYNDYKEISEQIERLKSQVSKALERWSELAERESETPK
jgi:hypothetical protein